MTTLTPGQEMTREIFWAKWSYRCKFVADFLMRHMKRLDTIPNDRLAVTADLEAYKECLIYIKIFEAEAHNLGYDEEPLRTQVANDLATDLTPFENPFRDMAITLAMVDRFVEEAKMSKTGQYVQEWPMWQTLPLATRRGLNDLIEDFDKEQEQGRCVLSKEIEGKLGDIAQ